MLPPPLKLLGGWPPTPPPPSPFFLRLWSFDLGLDLDFSEWFSDTLNCAVFCDTINGSTRINPKVISVCLLTWF